jgi:hypothetical protein
VLIVEATGQDEPRVFVEGWWTGDEVPLSEWYSDFEPAGDGEAKQQ